MTETLVLQINENDPEWVAWVVVDDTGAQVEQQQGGSLAQAAELATGRRVLVLVPAMRALRLRAEMPLRGASKILQALPFALEEQLAQDVETLHFAAGTRDADGLIPVAVIDRDYLDQWTSWFEEAGLTPTGIFADSDAIALLPSTTTVLLDRDQLILRDPQGNTAVADADNLDTILELFLTGASESEDDAAGQQRPINLLVYCSAEQHAAHESLWERLRLEVESLEIKVLPNGALPKLASQLTAISEVNLLQGRYAPQSDYSKYWPAWRIAAMLLAGFILLNFVVKGAELFQMERQEDLLDQAAEQVLRSTFPDISQVRDPWGQLQSRLSVVERGGDPAGTGFIEALAALADAVSGTEGISMKTLSYRNGTVTLRLLAPGVENLDQLQQAIGRSGRFSAVIQSANPVDDAVEGRLQITDQGG